MTVPCPDPRELTRLLDGELTENRGALLRTHAASCARCAAELAAQERLLSRISAQLTGVPSAGALAAVMDRLDAADPAALGPLRLRHVPRAWAGLALAAAAAVLAVIATRPARHDEFAPRGAAVGWEQKVGVELWALQGQPRRLAAGDRLAPGVAVVASYSNVDPSPAWLLSFAVDERGEVHWLYPGYVDATRDPQALRLEGSVVQRALPESVVLEEVPEGALRLVTVVTRAPLRVSDVEAAPPADRTPEALRRRWPDARVDELVLRYAPAPAAAPGGRP
jgi:hypothetical protein